MPVLTAPPTPAPPRTIPVDPALNQQYAFPHGISLLHGWLPLTLELLTAAILLVAVARRTRRWWLIELPVSVAIGGAAALAARWYVADEGLASDPAPLQLWVWVGAVAAAAAIAVAGWSSARWWRRGIAVLAIPLTLLSTGIVLNQWVGYYPTVQAAWGAATAGPLPHQTDLSALPALRNTTVTDGKLVPVRIPDAGSGFPHRTEYVYLPPAWFAGPNPPALPVVMMIGGEFNTPADWIRSGQIMPALDGFTRENGGQAPILVFVDASGSFNNDTECVDGPRGDAADHLTKDVPAYIRSRFGASADPALWAVLGWSMGGTCAVNLAVMHPDLLHTFVDIAGDLRPSSGSTEQTISRLFGGNADAFAAFDPLTVMARHGPYSGVAGLFDDLRPAPRAGGGNRRAPGTDDANAGVGGRHGGPDSGEVGAAGKLCDAARAVDIDCTVYTTEGGHTWQFASAAFTSSLPWVVGRLGLPVPATS
ncbi:alpha/beta hydrolase-fold protein [Nocardia sp. R6R-6]|uniref:alpha/beta hydrolase-fold protein n=1 Tax=Nocardia sp. R6R-6 TaxID=3459303 RepID=UPI00403D81C9